MKPKPCYRNLDKPIVALWGLEPGDLLVILVGAGLFMVLTNVVIGLVGGTLLGLGYKALKSGKPRGYVFYLFYRSGVIRLLPNSLRPPYLVIPPPLAGKKVLRFSPAPGPEDDETSEARFYRGSKDFLR